MQWDVNGTLPATFMENTREVDPCQLWSGVGEVRDSVLILP